MAGICPLKVTSRKWRYVANCSTGSWKNLLRK